MSDLRARIKAAYERDMQRKDEKVYTAAQLPITYAAVTKEWLTDILCKAQPGAAVTSFKLDAPDNGSSNRQKIYIEYNAAGKQAKLPTALFCKAGHDLTNRVVLGVSGGAHAEVTFYNLLRPLLDIEAPVSYFAKYDPETFNSIIVLGDISGTVTEFCSHKTVMTRQRAETQMNLLGKQHGKSYSDPTLKKNLQQLVTWPEFFQKTLGFGMREGSSKGFLSAESVIPPSLYKRYEEVWPNTMKSVELHNQLPATLMHGDVHLKNWYVAGSGEMGLGDWQCASRGHWGRDVAYTIATALTVEDRRLWEKDLLRLFLDRMQAAGGPKVSFDDAWLYYRQQLMSALTWWTVTLTPPPGIPDMQPQDISLEFIRRITTAMVDVDTLGSLA